MARYFDLDFSVSTGTLIVSLRHPLNLRSEIKRESDTRFSTSGFFHESVSPRPPSIPVEPFWIFSKIRRDIRELLFITGVSDNGNKLYSGVNDTSEKFIAGVVDTGD